MFREVRIGLFLLLTALLTGCNDESSIPDAPVYVERNLLSEAQALRTTGGYVEIIAGSKVSDRLGYGGILIYHTLSDEICAFDMSCPVEKSRTIRAHIDETGIYATCEGCGSRYNVSYGSGAPISGSAKEGLKKYEVRTTGTTITVFR